MQPVDMTTRTNDPLHGKTLEMILLHLLTIYRWEDLHKLVRIKCFLENPSVRSSLKFLHRTPWARKKVEEIYLKTPE